MSIHALIPTKPLGIHRFALLNQILKTGSGKHVPLDIASQGGNLNIRLVVFELFLLPQVIRNTTFLAFPMKLRA